MRKLSLRLTRPASTVQRVARAALILLALTAATPSTAQTAGQDQPNILLILTDQQFATVSELAGSPMPEGPYYGKSAVPLARSTDPSAPTHDFVVTEAEVTSNSGDNYQGRSVRTPQFKYHAWDLGADREQLFDMIKDPGETHNLAADTQYAAILDQHRDLLTQWLANTDDTYHMAPAPKKAKSNKALSRHAPR